MTPNRNGSKRIVQLASFAVIVAVWLILSFPLFFRRPAPIAAAIQGQAEPGARPATPATLPTSGALGQQEQGLLSWLAPLLNPGEDTTAFENITPEVRKILLAQGQLREIERLQAGLNALDELPAMTEKLRSRRTALARTKGFVAAVGSSPAQSLWEEGSSRSLFDDQRPNEYRRDFQAAIDRLKKVATEGYRQLNDPRLDARKELAQVDKAVTWVKDQREALANGQRDLDRVEFTIWTRALSVPAKVRLPKSVMPVRQVSPNLKKEEQLQMIHTVVNQYDQVREQTMQFLQMLPTVNEQVQSFLRERAYADDPVGKLWASGSLPSEDFLAEFHEHELAVELSERQVRTDSQYTGSEVLAPVVAANEWANASKLQLTLWLGNVALIRDSIAAAPIYVRSNALTVDGRPATTDPDVVTRAAALRKIVARHSYAVKLSGHAQKYNWAVADLLEPYTSFDYWWR